MSRVQRFIYVVCFAVLLPIHYAVAADHPAIPKSVSLDVAKFNDKAIEDFTGKTRVAFPDDNGQTQAVSVSDRILFGGYLVDLRRLEVSDGITIDWGFKYQEDNLESVIVYDRTGRPRLLAAVDDIPWCNGFHCQPFDSMSAYEQNVKQTERSPSISIFVRDKRDINTYLPYLMRWLQANLLGFNVDCKDPRMAEACKAVPQIAETQIPIDAYLLPSMRPLGVPKVKAADIPLEAFTQ
jgi:hypothetical protein